MKDSEAKVGTNITEKEIFVLKHSAVIKVESSDQETK